MITNYKCDSIIETGTHLGDTTCFLAKTYPHLKIITCESNRMFYDISKTRLSKYDNVEVVHDSSEKVIEKHLSTTQFPLIYLDAHWEDYWPLQDEIKHITHGIVCVGDFNIKDARFGFDTYNDIVCDLSHLTQCTTRKIYCNNPNSMYHLPLMTNQRMGGRAYFFEGTDEDYLDKGDNFSIAS